MVVALQVAIAKHGLQTLLTINYYFTEVLSQGDMPDPQLEQKLVWLCGGILSNIALHPNNRSVMQTSYACNIFVTSRSEHIHVY